MNRLYYALIIIYISLSMVSCESDKETGKSKENKTHDVSLILTREQLLLMDIQLSSLKEKIMYPQIYASGVIAAIPNLDAVVTPGINGTIDKIFVSEGSHVVKNQPLMSLSSTELIQLQQDYMTACNDARFLEKEYKRQTTLRNSNIGPASEFELTESKYLNAKSLEKSLKAKIQIQGIDPSDLADAVNANVKAEKIIRSPITGTIYKLAARLGMRAEQSNVLGEIIDLSQLRAIIYCYEKDLFLIKPNERVSIKFINEAIPVVTGRIDNVSGTKDSETKAIVIHASFEAPKGYLILPGMSISAIVKGVGKGKASKIVPQSAIYDAGGNQKYVFYASDSASGKTLSFHKAKVKTGSTDGEDIEIFFIGKIPANIIIASKNVESVENEFKKLSNTL